jgi:hypothetical protein
MGFWDWSRSGTANRTATEDFVWLTKQAKFHGIGKAVEAIHDKSDRRDAVVLVAQFADCLAELRQIAAQIGGHVAVVSAADLRQARPAGMPLGESQFVHFLVGERHPLPAHETAIVDFASTLPCRRRVVFHASLDEPLMRAFAGEWVESTLKKLGMADDEAIQSTMVSNRIRGAQKKLAGECHSEFAADSAEEWMAKNCPQYAKGQR